MICQDRCKGPEARMDIYDTHLRFRMTKPDPFGGDRLEYSGSAPLKDRDLSSLKEYLVSLGREWGGTGMTWNIYDQRSMTQDAQKVYLQNDGKSCPLCGSASLHADGDPSQDSDSSIRMGIQCWNCGRHWYDIYTLTGMEM